MGNASEARLCDTGFGKTGGGLWKTPLCTSTSLTHTGSFPPLVSVAHTPDNSFMGFVSEELNETEKQFIKSNKVSNMAVVYGKEASIWKVGALTGVSRLQRAKSWSHWHQWRLLKKLSIKLHSLKAEPGKT